MWQIQYRWVLGYWGWQLVPVRVWVPVYTYGVIYYYYY
jgi:hypothetical protein